MTKEQCLSFPYSCIHGSAFISFPLCMPHDPHVETSDSGKSLSGEVRICAQCLSTGTERHE
ncbi:hypothetical protein Tco_1248525, partial [Tanacetum coccineum]